MRLKLIKVTSQLFYMFEGGKMSPIAIDGRKIVFDYFTIIKKLNFRIPNEGALNILTIKKNI